MLELYVYYRVAPALTPQAAQQVRALQAELRARWPDLSARWLQRAAEHEAAPQGGADASVAQTWMEIYTRPAGLSRDDIATILQAGIDRVRSIDGPRHPEVFDPCA